MTTKYRVQSGSINVLCLAGSPFNAAIDSLEFAKPDSSVDGEFVVQDINTKNVWKFDTYDVLNAAGWIIE